MSKLSVTRPSHIFTVRTSGSYTRTKADEILSQFTGNWAKARTVVIRDLLAIPIVSLDFSGNRLGEQELFQTLYSRRSKLQHHA